MKKVFLILVIQIFITGAALAQINWSEYSQSYTDRTNDKSSNIGLILALRKGNDFLWSLREQSHHFSTLDKETAFRHLRPGEIIARTTFDTARAQFFLHGVNPENARLYQYRVMEYPGNQVLIPWQSIRQFTDSGVIKSSGMPKMAYLGGYKTSFDKTLIMDIRKNESNKIVATSLVAWELITPIITNVYTSKNLDEFFKKLQHPWAPVKQTSGNRSSILKVPSANANIIFILKGEISYRKQIQYELTRNGSLYSSWRYNDYDNSFIWIKDCPPGSYVIKIRFSGQPLTNVTQYTFEIEPTWYQSNLFRIVVGIFIAAVIGALLFLMLYVRQKRKTKLAQEGKGKLQLELKAIYAQLNPHFVFNALSSIQGLINKQDIKNANYYLSDFARLMRQSLNNSNKEQISVEEEIKMIETYLKLEQLRFGFDYVIDVSLGINIYETSIPILLLQPLVENAVKHGVSSRHQNGCIRIEFKENESAMLVSIADNGPGITEKKSSQGYGLKLTRDRINLLNKLNPEQQIVLDISNSITGGMQITFTFNQWFL